MNGQEPNKLNESCISESNFNRGLARNFPLKSRHAIFFDPPRIYAPFNFPSLGPHHRGCTCARAGGQPLSSIIARFLHPHYSSSEASGPPPRLRPRQVRSLQPRGQPLRPCFSLVLSPRFPNGRAAVCLFTRSPALRGRQGDCIDGN